MYYNQYNDIKQLRAFHVQPMHADCENQPSILKCLKFMYYRSLYVKYYKPVSNMENFTALGKRLSACYILNGNWINRQNKVKIFEVLYSHLAAFFVPCELIVMLFP